MGMDGSASDGVGGYPRERSSGRVEELTVLV
jgi:hypothetical protein